jgi:hypothetical protein
VSAGNAVRVDRGVLFDLLLAAEAALSDQATTFLLTTGEDRLAEMRESAAEIREELLG